MSDPVAGRVRAAPLALVEEPSAGVAEELDVDVDVVVLEGVVVVVGDTAVDVPDDDVLVPEEVLPLSPLPPGDGGFSV